MCAGVAMRRRGRPLWPNERLNADLKHSIGSKVAACTKARLKAAATEHMQILEANPERVNSYFRETRLACAA